MPGYADPHFDTLSLHAGAGPDHDDGDVVVGRQAEVGLGDEDRQVGLLHPGAVGEVARADAFAGAGVGLVADDRDGEVDFVGVTRRGRGDRVKAWHQLALQFDDFLGGGTGGRELLEEVDELALLEPGLLLLRVGLGEAGGQGVLVLRRGRAVMEQLHELVGRSVQRHALRPRLAERGRRGPAAGRRLPRP